MPKTGTTFLQENIFPKFKEVNYYRGWTSFRSMLKNPNQNPILISDESILGDMFDGSFNKNFEKKCNNLQTLFGDPEIIIGYREQNEFIKSLYKQRLNQGGTEEFQEFFNIENTGLIKVDDLFYHDKLETLKKKFNKVYVYTFDDFIKNKQNFINNLCTFLKVPNIGVINHDEVKNKGAFYDYQVRKLLKYNRINNKIKDFPFSIGLYNSLFRKLKITPRDLFTKNVNKPKSLLFEIPQDIQEFIEKKYSDDWKKIISIK